MKRVVVVTETVVYHMEIDAPEGADNEAVESIALVEWMACPVHKPTDSSLEFYAMEEA